MVFGSGRCRNRAQSHMCLHINYRHQAYVESHFLFCTFRLVIHSSGARFSRITLMNDTCERASVRKRSQFKSPKIKKRPPDTHQHQSENRVRTGERVMRIYGNIFAPFAASSSWQLQKNLYAMREWERCRVRTAFRCDGIYRSRF